MLDMGAHHSCWLVFQALLMIASVLTVTSTTATRTTTRGVFMANLPTGPEAYLAKYKVRNVNIVTQQVLRRIVAASAHLNS